MKRFKRITNIPWDVVARKDCLAPSRAIVGYQCLDFVTHIAKGVLCFLRANFARRY